VVGEIARRLRRVCEVALAYAGAAAYPLVGRVDPAGEFVVAHDILRQITAGADNA
jgi:hypothetical protein